MTSTPPTVDKGALRRALLARHPWLAATDRGPRDVDAGECGRCGDEAALVRTCGPGVAAQIGRRCARALGVEAWCAGHEDEALDVLDWLDRLPDDADAAARLWWVATGEVRVDPALVADRAARLGLDASAGAEGGVRPRPDREARKGA